MEDFKVIDDYLCVKLPEEIDHHKSAYISENADRLILAEQVSNVIFDYSASAGDYVLKRIFADTLNIRTDKVERSADTLL